MFNRDGKVKLIDFGLSKKFSDGIEYKNMSFTDTRGTPYYYGVENYFNKQDGITNSLYSDIYSVGKIFLELFDKS